MNIPENLSAELSFPYESGYWASFNICKNIYVIAKFNFIGRIKKQYVIVMVISLLYAGIVFHIIQFRK